MSEPIETEFSTVGGHRIYPMLDGERIQRRLSEHYIYLGYAYRADRPRLDESQTMIDAVALIPDDNYRKLTTLHFEDANNERLPLYVRVQHFDIAGSILWEAMTMSNSEETRAAAQYAFIGWMDMGGK